MLLFLGGVFFEAQWDLVKARSLIDEGLMLLRELPQSWFNKWLLEIGLNTSAEIALSQNNLDVARSQAEKALALLTEIKKERQGMKGDIAWTLSVIAQVEAHQGNYTEARSRYPEILTLAREGGDKVGLIYYLEQLAEVVAAQREVAWAARLWGAAETLHETIGSPLPPVYRAGYKRTVAAARSRLGKQPFVTAWAEGRTMTLEQVLALAEQVAISIPFSVDQPATSPAKAASASPAGLSAREVEVLRLVAQGLTDLQVAERLVISPRTVNTRLTSIYNKLGVDSRTAASRYAIEHHLV
jgi:DNA-binding CsgD family transcriptional regulator